MPSTKKEIIEKDVVIVGYGFSSLPLIRELENTGTNYIVISEETENTPIWENFERRDRLDFDLVSSILTSMYSFELVNRKPDDYYPPSREYMEFIKKYKAQYIAKVIKDWVTLIENKDDHSMVYTRDGRTFRARHIVLATNFKRKITNALFDFDFESVENKTIAITAVGDSGNLIVSKLVPFKNRVILITNGFFPLDKFMFADDTSYTIDQLEFHNVRYLSKLFYRQTIAASLPFSYAYCNIFTFLGIKTIYAQYKMVFQNRNIYSNLKQYFFSSPVPNGLIVIKYWPIDTYYKLFNNDVEGAIKKGFLLNDITYFIDKDLVEIWPKNETIIDRENRVIKWKDKIVQCDSIIDGDHEDPNFPEIKIIHKDKPVYNYHYICRNNFMGMIPAELNNVYCLGLMRPSTGGLNNLNEMQCLLTHKMTTNEAFNEEIRSNIGDRIKKYNAHYYTKPISPIDHLVFYGFYTEDIAKLLKINLRLRDCRSIKDVFLYYLFPNNAFKYRQKGEYKVEGVEKMVQEIFKRHKYFSYIFYYLLTIALINMTVFTLLILLAYNFLISIPVFMVLFILSVCFFTPISVFITDNCGGKIQFFIAISSFLLIMLGAAVYFKYPSIPAVSLLVSSCLAYLFRKSDKSRLFFYDLKIKRENKYQVFFEKYLVAFRKIFNKKYKKDSEI